MRTGAESAMVPVPAGSVVLADRRSRRSWAVDVAAHQMSASLVTQAQYAQVTGEWPSTARGDRLPVEGVSWWDAVRFCQALSQQEQLVPAYRLDPDGEGIDWDASADGYRLPIGASRTEHAVFGADGRTVVATVAESDVYEELGPTAVPPCWCRD
jgi:sulfatase modifying factor 1